MGKDRGDLPSLNLIYEDYLSSKSVPGNGTKFNSVIKEVSSRYFHYVAFYSHSLKTIQMRRIK